MKRLMLFVLLLFVALSVALTACATKTASPPLVKANKKKDKK